LQKQSNDLLFNSFTNLPVKSSFLKFWRNNKARENDSCIEIWQAKKVSELEIVGKFGLTGLSALGTSKKSPSSTTFAVGFTTGKIKVHQLTKGYKVLQAFNPPSASPSGVIFLDYNSSNDQLASTYENGLINIYSLQTSVKFDTLKLDGSSTLARFHPSRNSLLGIASYKGTATLYDVFSKKAIFKNTTAHNAPCSDIAFTESYVLSAGYDGLVNIFDIRKQSVGLKISGSYAWTTLAVSHCGAYFVGGNMKGELVTYDLRSIKKPLASARIEKGSQKISRVEFLNSSSSIEMDDQIDKEVRHSLMRAEEEIGSQSSERADNNDSYIEEIADFARGRVSDFSTSALNHVTKISTPSRKSDEVDYKRLSKDDFSRRSDDTLFDDSRVTKRKDVVTKRRSSIMPPALRNISEESNDKENDGKYLNTPSKAFKGTLETTSTPAIRMSTASSADDVNDVDREESFKSVETAENSKQSIDKYPFDLRKEFESLKESLSEKIRIEVGMLNMDENYRFVQLMNHITDQKQKLQERLSMVEECMAMMMNDDFKINRIMELQAENDVLRKELMGRRSQF
jgi:hypothetical protein